MSDVVVRLSIFPLLVAFAVPVFAEPMMLAPLQVTYWKAVYGRIEARDRIPARARLVGYLDRASDTPPGTTVIWRGFSRLAYLVEGARIATSPPDTYG